MPLLVSFRGFLKAVLGLVARSGRSRVNRTVASVVLLDLAHMWALSACPKELYLRDHFGLDGDPS